MTAITELYCRGRTPKELGQRQAVRVVLDDERHVQPRPEQADEAGLLIERRVRRPVHDVVGRAIGPGGSHPHGFDLAAAGDVRDELQDVRNDAILAEPWLGRDALPGQHGPRAVHETRLDLGPAEIDSDGIGVRSRHFNIPPSSAWRRSGLPGNVEK
jgi:hypothetical protein